MAFGPFGRGPTTRSLGDWQTMEFKPLTSPGMILQVGREFEAPIVWGAQDWPSTLLPTSRNPRFLSENSMYELMSHETTVEDKKHLHRNGENSYAAGKMARNHIIVGYTWINLLYPKKSTFFILFFSFFRDFSSAIHSEAHRMVPSQGNVLVSIAWMSPIMRTRCLGTCKICWG